MWDAWLHRCTAGKGVRVVASTLHAARACAAAPPPPAHGAECCPAPGGAGWCTTRAPAPPYLDARGIAWVACRCDGASITPSVIRVAQRAYCSAKWFLQQDDRHVRHPRDLTCTGSERALAYCTRPGTCTESLPSALRRVPPRCLQSPSSRPPSARQLPYAPQIHMWARPPPRHRLSSPT